MRNRPSLKVPVKFIKTQVTIDEDGRRWNSLEVSMASTTVAILPTFTLEDE